MSCAKDMTETFVQLPIICSNTINKRLPDSSIDIQLPDCNTNVQFPINTVIQIEKEKFVQLPDRLVLVHLRQLEPNQTPESSQCLRQVTATIS